ncbi:MULTISPECIES: hypothetical protein [unclassified Bacillus cereus group]|uniref:hypothetical protein n=1 Tax=unclassified Bacillus cereus group TaxID=2750818 RepID=UPI001F597271|nr:MULTISPECIES: hypothetical protein [unclassified Bacillus cereus group]
MYIFIGCALLFIVLLFLFAQKFAPNSAMMSSFKTNGVKKLIFWLITASLFSLSYGIYHATTYHPSFLDITVDDKQYTVFGNIGEFGYFSNKFIKKDTETELYFISWKPLHLKKPQMIINYPSGKKETLQPNISLIKNKIDKTYKIQEIYRMSPISFHESGTIMLTIKENGVKCAEVQIKVK